MDLGDRLEVVEPKTAYIDEVRSSFPPFSLLDLIFDVILGGTARSGQNKDCVWHVPRSE